MTEATHKADRQVQTKYDTILKQS